VEETPLIITSSDIINKFDLGSLFELIMSGLIPLVLRPATSFQETITSTPQEFRTQPGSTQPLRQSSSPTLYTQAAPTIPPKSPRRDKTIRNLQMPREPLPETGWQWRDMMDEVRNLYLKQQYRKCCSRCLQALEAAKGPVSKIFLIC
jgi:hypothetical protein